jgi:hypothetical protein
MTNKQTSAVPASARIRINRCAILLLGFMLCSTFADAAPTSQPSALYPSTRPAEQDARGAEVKVVSSSPAPKLLEPIAVEVQLRNLDERPLAFTARISPDRDFLLLLTDEHDRPVPLTRYGAELYRPRSIDVGSAIRLVAKKSEAFRAILPLTRIYDLTQPGKYTLVVEAYPFQRAGPLQVRLRSDPIQIEIRPELYKIDSLGTAVLSPDEQAKDGR